MTVNNMQCFKCKIVSGTRILIKLFLVVSCVLLSACHIEDQKVTSEKGIGSNRVFLDRFDRYIYF